MVTSASVVTALEILLKTLANSQHTVDRINQDCTKRNLPLAFPINEDGTPDIPGNTDYRFDGFGVVLGLPPKLSFYVHYKPDSPQHQELGKFTVPIGFGKVAELNRLLG